MPDFNHPDFSAARFAGLPEARFVAAPADGVLPEGFFSTTNLPTYVRIGRDWRMPREPRMDGALVLDADGDAVGAARCAASRAASSWRSVRRRMGREGIFVYADAFLGEPRRVPAANSSS